MATKKATSTSKPKTQKPKAAKPKSPKAAPKTPRAGRKTRTTKTTPKTTAKAKMPTAKKPTKVTPKPTPPSKAKMPSPELPGGQATITTPAPSVRVYSASVGFRSKVWGLLYAQRSTGNKIELCMQDAMTHPEAVRASRLLDSQESIVWVKVMACPTAKQMRG